MLNKIMSTFGNFKGRVQIYGYRPGATAGDLGAGANGLALMKPQSDPILAPYPANNMPRGQLATYQGSFTPDGQLAVVTGLAHGGLFTGSITLQALADFQSGKQ